MKNEYFKFWLIFMGWVVLVFIVVVIYFLIFEYG